MVYLAVALSAALGGFVQSITGFGAAVVMMTILPYFFTMAVAPSVSTSICLGLTVTLAWKLRKSIDLKLTLPPTLLYAAASVTAIRFIGSMDLRVMTMVFGAFLMLLGAYLLLTEKKAAIRVTPAVTVVCGLLAGVCGGLFSIGGPIMAIYYLAATDSRESYLANAQANFAVNNVTSITTRVLSGYYTLDLLAADAARRGGRGLRAALRAEARRKAQRRAAPPSRLRLYHSLRRGHRRAASIKEKSAEG